MDIKSNKNEQKVPDQFKMDVFTSLKHYGLIFPTSEKEIELFDKLCGSTHVDMPFELKNSDSILEWGEKTFGASSSPVQAIAARKGEKGLSEASLKKMKEIHEKTAKKKEDKRKS